MEMHGATVKVISTGVKKLPFLCSPEIIMQHETHEYNN
jgi:hypothetical protein